MSTPLSSSVSYRVRFDESGPGGTLRASTLLRYAQDTAWIHSERLGFDRDWYAARGLTWLVRCAEVEIVTTPLMGETIDATTTIVGYRKVWARRRTDVDRADGSRAATAITDWVMTGDRGQPTRIPDDFVRLMGDRVASFEPARVALPATPPDANTVRFGVREHELDPMSHVNNAVYLDWLEEAARPLAATASLLDGPRRYGLEYLLPAGSGAALVGSAWPLDAGIAYRLVTTEGVEVLRATVGPSAGRRPGR